VATPLRKVVKRQADGFVITLEPNPAGLALVEIHQVRCRQKFYLRLDQVFCAAVKATMFGMEPVKKVARKSEAPKRRQRQC
jgi:hypothetical protein